MTPSSRRQMISAAAGDEAVLDAERLHVGLMRVRMGGRGRARDRPRGADAANRSVSAFHSSTLVAPRRGSNLWAREDVRGEARRARRRRRRAGVARSACGSGGRPPPGTGRRRLARGTEAAPQTPSRNRSVRRNAPPPEGVSDVVRAPFRRPHNVCSVGLSEGLCLRRLAPACWQRPTSSASRPSTWAEGLPSRSQGRAWRSRSNWPRDRSRFGYWTRA